MCVARFTASYARCARIWHARVESAQGWPTTKDIDCVSLMRFEESAYGLGYVREARAYAELAPSFLYWMSRA